MEAPKEEIKKVKDINPKVNLGEGSVNILQMQSRTQKQILAEHQKNPLY